MTQRAEFVALVMLVMLVMHLSNMFCSTTRKCTQHSYIISYEMYYSPNI